jgi:hypothetical protein
MDERELVTVLRLRRAVVVSQLEHMLDRRSHADYASGDIGRYARLCNEERALLCWIRDEEHRHPFN